MPLGLPLWGLDTWSLYGHWAFLGMVGQMPLMSLTAILRRVPRFGNALFWIVFCIIGQPSCVSPQRWPVTGSDLVLLLDLLCWVATPAGSTCMGFVVRLSPDLNRTRTPTITPNQNLSLPLPLGFGSWCCMRCTWIRGLR